MEYRELVLPPEQAAVEGERPGWADCHDKRRDPEREISEDRRGTDTLTGERTEAATVEVETSRPRLRLCSDEDEHQEGRDDGGRPN